MTIIDSELHIGLMTRQLLNKLEDEGDITHREVRVFHNAVRNFLTTAADYALSNLPIKDKLLQNAGFLNFEKKRNVIFFTGGIFRSQVSN